MTDLNSYKLNHTMLRVKDIEKSRDFYCRLLGMQEISSLQFDSFSLYFFGYNTPKSILDASQEERKEYAFGREGILELTHNHGTEKDDNFNGYCSGNDEGSKGFGHICISVDNVEKACERLDSEGVRLKKKPNEGKMKGIAFALDPDGYWIEIITSRSV